MSLSGTKITPEILSTDCTAYLIRNNKEEVSLVERESDARLAIDSFAAAIVKELTNEYTKVYREDVNENKVIISTQALGYIMNGSIVEHSVIDYIPLNFVIIEKGRYEKEPEQIIPNPPPLPPFEAIATRPETFRITPLRNCIVKRVSVKYDSEEEVTYEDELSDNDESYVSGEEIYEDDEDYSDEDYSEDEDDYDYSDEDSY